MSDHVHACMTALPPRGINTVHNKAWTILRFKVVCVYIYIAAGFSISHEVESEVMGGGCLVFVVE